MKADQTFYEKVYLIVRKIPFGRVTSYGAIANYLGTKGAARMVGWAMNSSHNYSQKIPAHRVVNRNGVLTGKMHFGGPHLMQQLLENENIKVVDDQIIDFQKYFWDPMTEL